MSKTKRAEWDRANMVTLSCRVRKEVADRLREITEAEEVSTHRLLLNLLTEFMDEYEKGDAQ